MKEGEIGGSAYMGVRKGAIKMREKGGRGRGRGVVERQYLVAWGV